MADLTATFETGVSGNNILTSDAGSATAWNDSPGGTGCTYSTTHVHGGALAAKIVGPGGSNYFDWIAAFDATDHYGRLYIYRTAHPTNKFAVVYHSGTSGLNWRLNITTSGFLELAEGSTVLVTGAVAMTLNAWVRVEWHLLNHASAGVFEAKLFNSPESGTATETITQSSYNTGTNTTDVYLANTTGPVASSSDYWLDDIVAQATSYPGPSVVAAALPPRNWLQQPNPAVVRAGYW